MTGHQNIYAKRTIIIIIIIIIIHAKINQSVRSCKN
jgi:hypothetical protein